MSRAGSPKSKTKPSRAKTRRFDRRKLLHLLRVTVQWFICATALLVLVLRFAPAPITPLMAIRCLQQKSQGHKLKLAKQWRRLDRISPNLTAAVLAAEDQQFLDHGGFDWDAIGSAFMINQSGRRKLGASTITQQTAKNLFLWPERSWSRKALEAWFTFLLETFWSKRRILEVYLNVIEMGDGVYGAEAAARKYFGVSAAELTREQAALISAILPNPRHWSPVQPTEYLLRRQEWILRQMDQMGPLNLGRGTKSGYRLDAGPFQVVNLAMGTYGGREFFPKSPFSHEKRFSFGLFLQIFNERTGSGSNSWPILGLITYG
jgi:monofunctional biosynthetic peptidoglycan transglycosylase